MSACKLFISYSHSDEWLKDELIAHLAGLKRNGFVDVWHDRRIPAGGILDDEINANILTTDVFLFLISPDFINSDYCFHKEYEEAVKRRKAGEAEIIPIIIRACDWDVGELRKFNALPRDAVPITQNASSRPDKQQRDPAWLNVINGIKVVMESLKKKLQPPKLLEGYYDELFKVDFIRHPALARFDERRILVDPDVYCENEKEQISTFARLFEMCSAEKAVLITGPDRSGKSMIAKKLYELFSTTDHPAILISGKQIRNKDIQRLINAARIQQFEASTFPIGRFRIVIDDFDDCALPDQVKESIIQHVCANYESCILVSFSNAQTVLFTSNNLPSPTVFLINPIADAKLYTLVEKWVAIGLPDGEVAADERVLATFEKIQLVFEQTGLEKAPHAAATFLQFIDTMSGSDINLSSYAACYDMLIVNRLGQAGVDIKSFDEARNFLSFVAYCAYNEGASACITQESFEKCLQTFQDQFLSSKSALRKMAVGPFLFENEEGLIFHEEYLWFFLCARYVVKVLQHQDHSRYTEFVNNCTANIFQRKFANIVIYIAYFSTDKFVLESLLKTLDGLFAKANEWVISDDTRELMIGAMSKDKLEINSQSDVAQNRMVLLQEKIADIIDDAERVVARYTLPFLSPRIGDAGNIDKLELAPDPDSYIKSVNALLRTHSVIGQILGSRSGTFSASLVLDCIARMVRASGRYVSLNHAIAAVLIYDRDNSVQELGEQLRGDHLTPEEKYEKVMRIFAFWSVYISHAGLARYLNQEHSIRALERLSETLEGEDSKTETGHYPFNFTFVKVVARLYNSGRIDRAEIDDIVAKYGENSAIMAMLRVVIHMYAYYMPLEIEDKQWVSQKLRMPIRKIELQRLKAITAKTRHGQAVRDATGA